MSKQHPQIDSNGRPRTPYAIYCVETFDVRPTGCGLVYLTKTEYDQQMSCADYSWCCPLCNGSAYWDDDNYEELMYPEGELSVD